VFYTKAIVLTSRYLRHGSLGFFGAGRDQTCVVAGLWEAGRSRYAGVTDPGYNCRCYLALTVPHKVEGMIKQFTSVFFC
jgi:hypothetical protein